jgi:hypothetical protein
MEFEGAMEGGLVFLRVLFITLARRNWRNIIYK